MLRTIMTSESTLKKVPNGYESTYIESIKLFLIKQKIIASN